VEPIAIEAAHEAERLRMEKTNDRRRMLELDLQKVQYEASLAERRYAACDPDNRLIAAQLEKGWESALRRVEACQARLESETRGANPLADLTDFAGLAADLEAAWSSPDVSMRARQQFLTALIVDIIADVDEVARDVILTIHWRGGQHSKLRVRKPKSGEHGCRTPDDAMAVSEAWRHVGLMSISLHRSIGWVCERARTKHGPLIASVRSDGFMASLLTFQQRRTVSG
jgi:hypothetical protein